MTRTLHKDSQYDARISETNDNHNYHTYIMVQSKELSKEQLKKRLERAVLHIDRTKDTRSIFFDDKGLRLTIDDEYAIIETSFHRHVFSYFTGNGVSRPYLYTKRFVEMALEKDCQTDDGHSYAKLFDVLKANEDKTEYNIAWYFDLWLTNIFQPLYSIGETEAESFLVYESYLHNIARNAILLSEKTEDMTNKQFIDKVIENIKEFTANIDERILFPKKTDEELMQENIDALTQIENERIIEEQSNGSQD